MSAKTSPARRAAFLRALAATGNQTIAAERAKVSRAWVQLHRTQDPAFRRAVEGAVEAAKARLAGAEEIRPPSGWGYLDGEELVVRGTNGRRVQVARAGPREFSPKVEARFLGVLAATCNVRTACAEIGMTAAAVYAHRHRRRGFADRWDAAVEMGYTRLEMGLVETAGSQFCAEDVEPDLDLGPATVAQALQLLHLYKQRVHHLGKPRRPAPPRTLEELRPQIIRKLNAWMDAKELGEAKMDEARRDWAARKPR